MQKNVTGQKWIVFAFNRGNNVPFTGDAANITANLRQNGGAASPRADTNPAELEGGYYAFDISQAESNADLLTICPSSTTAKVIVIGVPGSIFTEPAAQKYAATLAAADVSGNLPALVKAQDNIDFGALQKASLNAATPAVTVSDKTGFSLAVAPPTKEEISTKIWTETDRTLTDKSGFSLSVPPPTAAQVRAEIDSNSTKLADIHADIADIATLGGATAKTYTVYEADGVTPIVSCEVWATSDLAGATEIGNRGLTNDLGQHIFYFDLPAGATVYIWRRKALYTFTNPDAEVV